MRIWISLALHSEAAFATLLGVTGKTLLAKSSTTESLPWMIHWRALRMQGKIQVSAFFSETWGRLSSMSSCTSPLFPWLLWRCQIFSIFWQWVIVFSSGIWLFCWTVRHGITEYLKNCLFCKIPPLHQGSSSTLWNTCLFVCFGLMQTKT